MADDTRDAPALAAEGEEQSPAELDPLIEAELLIEDVSIDGMCGVY